MNVDSIPFAILAAVDGNRIALAVQQPWAELIVSGRKTLEIRSGGVRRRGPIYIYASKRPSIFLDASLAAERFQITSETLPRGTIVGGVNVIGCRLAERSDAAAACVRAETLQGKQAWQLAEAYRYEPPLAVEKVPYGNWFYPFRDQRSHRLSGSLSAHSL